MAKKAFITGMAGQDGSYLSEFLLEKGYEVHGLVRRVQGDAGLEQQRLGPLQGRVVLHEGDVNDFGALLCLLERIMPDECYHLASHSFVDYSFENASSVINTNINGTLNVLAALYRAVPRCRFYFAGSSEMFGLAQETPQQERTRFNPRAPYGISKVAGYYLTCNYRNAYGLFACNGILYNHESPRRGTEFVTRKITRAVAQIKHGLCSELRLGNLDARRDWGFAGDYIRAMWLMLQQDLADDYVVATGVTHSVREFVEEAFGYVGLPWQKYVLEDKGFFRPSEGVSLCGDAGKARRILGWRPQVDFRSLVRMMVDEDMCLLGQTSGKTG